ncbi:MAG: sugar-transfer associated ATP-grasp domain-containing protein [Pricia sp.]
MIPERKKQMLLFFLRDKNRKNWLQIIKEFTTLGISAKEFPLHYISHLLYRKNVTNYKDYLSLKENHGLLQWSYSHAQEEIGLIENKLSFEAILSKNNIPTPRIFFHNLKNRFIYEGTAFDVDTKSDFFSFLEKVFNEKKVERIFCKPVDGIRGENIFVIDQNTYREMADNFIDLVFSKAFIFQELIRQHEDLGRINQSSVNTLRVVTYKNKNNASEVFSAFIRVGRKGAIIDNAHIGGIVVAIDKETGKMRGEGIQLIDNGGGIFYKHPDTGIIFDTVQIPHFDKVKKIATQAASLFKFPLLGWDIAVTPDGPVIIEANHDFHLFLSDRMEKGLKRNPTFKKILEQIT